MTTYSIYLDDLDLALLPIEGRSCNNFLKKELFEFQLLAKEAEDPPVYTNITNHPCYICAIDVPVAFWSAHSVSAKHRAHARIATAATQRMSALITAAPLPNTPRSTEQFCDSCTCIVGKDHENTPEHKLSVFQDKMLCDLVMIYTGDDINNEQKENVKKKKKKKKDLKDTVEQEHSKKGDEDIPKAELNEFKLNTLKSAGVQNPTNEPNQSKIQNTTSKISETIVPRYNECSAKNTEEVKVNAKDKTTNNTSKQTNVYPYDTVSKELEIQERKAFVLQDWISCDLVPIYTGDDVNNNQKENAKKKKKKTKDSKDATDQEPSKKVNEDIAKADLNIIKLNADQTPKIENDTNIPNKNKTKNTGEVSEAKNTMPSYADIISNKNDTRKETKLNSNCVDTNDVSVRPLIDENAVHYPFVKELLEVRCLICDCVAPAGLHSRVTHLMGRRHVANANKLNKK